MHVLRIVYARGAAGLAGVAMSNLRNRAILTIYNVGILQ